MVQRVDIGKAYPDYLMRLLLSDSDDALQRQRLFGQQLRAQLPLQALTLAIQGTRTRYDRCGRLSQKAVHYQQVAREELPLLQKRYQYDASDNLVIERLPSRYVFVCAKNIF